MYTLSSTALEPGICYSAVHLRSRFCIKRTWMCVYTPSHRPMIILTHCTFCWLLFPVPSPKVRLASFSSWNNWNNLRTSFPAILHPGTSVHTATTIIIYFLKFRSHHVTPLLKAQMLLLFASWLKVTIVYLHLVLFFTLLSTWILASAWLVNFLKCLLVLRFHFHSVQNTL